MPHSVCDIPPSPQNYTPDSSVPSGEEVFEGIKETIEQAARDLLEQACKDAPFIPEGWCKPATEIIVDTFVNPPEIPPELQWNLESS